MATVLESLKALNAYPVPQRAIEKIAERRGLDLAQEVSQEGLQSGPFRLATADLYLWIYFAPGVTQGGQSYSFSDAQRETLLRLAYTIYGELDADGNKDTGGNKMVATYGYKGSNL